MRIIQDLARRCRPFEITKSFVGLAQLDLRQAGKIELATPHLAGAIICILNVTRRDTVDSGNASRRLLSSPSIRPLGRRARINTCSIGKCLSAKRIDLSVLNRVCQLTFPS